MALSIGEAIDVQTLLGYVLGEHDGHDRARDAAEALSEKAYRRLGAGKPGKQIATEWADLELPGRRTTEGATA